jgi:membrane fusion protein (multidrug efflux system)
MRRAVHDLVLAGLAAILLAGGCKGTADTGAPKPAADPIAVEVEKAAISAIDERLRLSGDVTPWQVQPLSFKVGGKIARLYVEEGDLVEKNQLVAVLDTVDYRLVRDLAEAQVAGIRPNIDRAEKLLQQEAISPAQMDELKSRLEAAEIQRAQASAQLSYSWLRAPADGVVMKRLMSEGDLTDPAHPVAAIAELKRAKVILPVTQGDLPLFHVGDTVAIREPGAKRRFEGRIFGIGYAADEKTRTFPVTLEVDNPDLLLRAGMIVEAEVVAATHRGIFLPLDAVRRDLDGHPAVFVAAGTPPRAREKQVDLGVIVGERVQIVAGLDVGDPVIVRGMVQSGEPVAVATAADGAVAPDGGPRR